MAAAAKTTSSSSSASPGRSWRTAFLTLRDEIQTLTSPASSSSSVLHLQLLDHHLFSQSDTLISAIRYLPPHEVTADVMLLMELARNVSFDEPTATLDDQLIQSFIRLSRFIHIVCSRVSFTINSKSWTLCLDCFTRMVDTFLCKAKANASFPGHSGVVGATKQCLETLKLLVGEYQKTILLSEYKQLLYMLHGVITFFQSNSSYSNYSTCHPSVWEVQRTAFTMIGELYSRAGTSLTVDIWQSTIEVIRKAMDALASKGLPAEDSVLTAFYYSLLHCLHLVLLDPKGSLSAHVAGFVAALKLFLNYGISSRNRFLFPEASQRKEIHSTWKKLNLAESSKSNSAPYRPPHLRKKEPKNLWLNNKESLSSSEPESSTAYQTSSDSDYSSDGDGSGHDVSNAHYDRSRLAAIVCIQDLCRADPKLFTSQWTMLLPCYDVLQPRKHEATLMSCLLFDPYLKARLMSASTIATMLDGTASVFLQVAEFKDSAKRGSFTALSSSLGQILMQLHTGTLYLVKHERRRSLLASLFKVLVPLISCTPYPRMPSDLLPKVISSIQGRVEDGFFLQSDHTSLLAAAIDCLTVALSVSPPSVEVKHMLSEEAAAGFPEEQKQNKPGVLSTLFRCSDPATSPLINFEALQALRAVAHNYPTTVFPCWKQVSSTIYGFLSVTPDVPTRLWKNNAGHSGGVSWETVITAAIKVLDECLRAVSGFKGTEDLSDDKFLLGPFTSDCVKTKTISSAPFHGSVDPTASEEEVEICSLGSEQWSEAIFKHIPCILKHPSGMVRTAAITCFAGLTSPVFFSLRKDDQNFILSCSLNAAAGDDVPSVRSAACRAIGVLSCFLLRSVEIVDKLVSAVVSNTSDSLISVRITASWALANISDSLRHSVHAPTFENDSQASFQLIELLIDNALRLTNDNDKIKANAVRALGNLSKFIQFPSNFDASNDEVSCMLVPITAVKNLSKVENIGENSKSFQSTTSKASVWLGKMVQAFISCVTTGNVKVQWNVCHALSNLFFNRTLKLQDMDWAPSVFSILLLLLRDSANFKIRIQAAAALAVPSRVEDYGRSFYDVLHGMVHVLENLSSDQISTPSNFKYRVALEKQTTSTLLHVLVLASGTNHRPIQDFLAKKALFLEEWLKGICLYLEERTIQLECEGKTYVNEKEAVARALQSLIKVLEDSNHTVIVPRFHKLLSGITR